MSWQSATWLGHLKSLLRIKLHKLPPLRNVKIKEPKP
jgi:hypothetical protein